MNALWWWIDRWRKSTAFMDMTLAEQGAYRNLLDEATLRGGALPNDDRILAKASGDAREWSRLRTVVMQRFDLRADGWHNETLDSVIHQSQRRKEKQARYRHKDGNEDGNNRGNEAGNQDSNEAGNGGVANTVTNTVLLSPISVSTKEVPPKPPVARGARRTRKELELAEAVRRSDPFGQRAKTAEMQRLIDGGMSPAEAQRQVFE